MQDAPRIVKNHYDVINAAAVLRLRFVPEFSMCLKYEKEK